MKKAFMFALCISLVCVYGEDARPVYRTWTVGRHQYEARLVSRVGDAVILERPGGKRLTVSITALSEADHAELGVRVVDDPWPANVASPGTANARRPAQERGDERVGELTARVGMGRDAAGARYLRITNTSGWDWTQVRVIINPGGLLGGGYVYNFPRVDQDAQRDFYLHRFATRRGERFDFDRTKIRQVVIRARDPRDVPRSNGWEFP